MSDFVKMMKDWKRMCISCQPNCEKCGLFEMGCDTANMMNEPDRAEKIITKWAAENPEPIYATWREVIEDITGIMMIDVVDDPVPADVAKKLGLNPKEYI